ncbi:hypothetical protein [Sphingobium aromaticiconvertens]|uniref:hypothetical protein n=1 Tax=Sphingobium aromaticiconvertens TaxID=365341 RepID=UPI003019D817
MKLIKMGQLLVFCALAACGNTGPSEKQVFDVARQQLRVGLASQGGRPSPKNDQSLEDVIKKSEYTLSEPCRSHPQMPQVIICGVKVNVALPTSNENQDNEFLMPVMMVKNRDAEWVDGMKCEGDFSPEC